MKRQQTPPDEALENDRVWELLDQSRPNQPSGQFVDDTVRAARLTGQGRSWSKSWTFGSLSAGILAAAAALVFTFLPETTPAPSPESSSTIADSSHAQEIQEIAETETLIAAVEHMDEFSDNELVALIGF